jgi:hypothetical protein
MQEKYLGDTPDFGKYALLRALCNKQTRLRLGVNWYLTVSSEVDKPDNKDGNKRHHATNPENYRPIDPELWEQLNHFQRDENRSLAKLESSGVLPRDTIYHSVPLSLADAKGKERKLLVRDQWVQAGLKTLEPTDVVFVDPDNGFEGSVQRHHKRGPKFTYYDEIKGFLDRNQTVVAIQFMGHQTGGVPALASAIKLDLKNKLNIDGNIHVLKNRAGKAILYFIIPAQRHLALISNSIDTFLHGPASSVFERVHGPLNEDKSALSKRVEGREISMDHQEIAYCDQCSQPILAAWKGWPHKDAIPLLPKLVNGKCEQCGSEKPLGNGLITWFNYHSEYSTGLPDYWLLIVDGERTKWGNPYYSEGKCSKCDAVAIISEMKFPNGKRELKSNCISCGVLNSA